MSGLWRHLHGVTRSVAPPSYANVVLADGAVAYWRLNAASGTTETDRSGSGWTATITGGVTLNQAGAITDGDPAELFDGATGTYVETNAAFTVAFGTGAMSLECWFKTSSALAQIGMIDDKDSGAVTAGVNLAMFAGTLQWRIADGVGIESVITTPTYNNGAYHHCVCTLTRGASDMLTIYVDGGLAVTASAGTSGRNITSAKKLRIGSYTNAGSPNSFIGQIDEVAIYTVALTPAQILNHYAVAKL